MRFRWEKKYLYGGITASCVIVFSIMFFVLLNNIQILTNFFSRVGVILTPFTIAFVMAYLLNPIMSYIESQWIDKLYFKIQENNPKFEIKKYKKFKRAIAIILSLAFGFAVIGSVFVMILPELYTSVAGIISNLPMYFANLQNFLDNTIEDMPWIEDYISIDIRQIGDQITSMITGLLPEIDNIINNITAGVMGIVTIVKNVFIAVVLCVYILSSKEMFGAQSRKFLFAVFPVKFANSVIRTSKHSDKVFGGFIVGKLIDSLIIGILCFIGLTGITILSPFEMPFILLISTVIGITNIIPFFGPFIGGVPCGVLIFLVDPMATLIFAIFILVLQQIDGNIIGPKILGDSTGLSAFWVMFAILLGGGLFGVAGMLLGVPTFSVCYSILTGFFNNILKHKGLPNDTLSYYDISEIDESDSNSYYMNYIDDQSTDPNETVIIIESKNPSNKTENKQSNVVDDISPHEQSVAHEQPIANEQSVENEQPIARNKNNQTSSNKKKSKKKK